MKCAVIHPGYHLAEYRCVSLVQVPFRKIVNLIHFPDFNSLGTVTFSSADIHLAKCMEWSLIQVISWNGNRTPRYFTQSKMIKIFAFSVLFEVRTVLLLSFNLGKHNLEA